MTISDNKSNQVAISAYGSRACKHVTRFFWGFCTDTVQKYIPDYSPTTHLRCSDFISSTKSRERTPGSALKDREQRPG